MLRKSFILVATASMVFCLASSAMWLRSVRKGDLFAVVGQHSLVIRSETGLIFANVSRADENDQRGWWQDAWPHAKGWSAWNGMGPRWWNRLGFGHYVGSTTSNHRVDQFAIPYYFVVLITAVLPVILLVRRFIASRQFSLRELFVAMTAIAVYFGIVALLTT
jgi:hypothetical protein